MTKTELIKGILEKAEQLKTSCSIETVMIIDEMEKLIDTYSEQLNLHNVSVSHFLITDAPDKIYLNTGFDFVESEKCQINFSELSNLTWSDERINDTDIEYSR